MTPSETADRLRETFPATGSLSGETRFPQTLLRRSNQGQPGATLTRHFSRLWCQETCHRGADTSIHSRKPDSRSIPS